ncbi:MAG TPA: 5'-nucleotidase, lipoprotein e(P4) family [Salinivirgaceae bacterium]|nr:5'-nucleotidase, lipoprotein e(P4) family [Salinivirgaceae bacterium]
MKSSVHILIILALIFSGCTSSTKEPKCSAEHSIQATYYYQTAAENMALCLQVYNLAKQRVDEIMSKKFDRKPAVVLDMDETVLDNSGFQAMSIINQLPYSDSLWNSWVRLKKARAVPGAVDFIKYALSKGIEVVYITNREEQIRQATLENMDQLGFPRLSDENYFFKTTTSDKTERRRQVAEKYSIELFIGDNLSDFSNIYDDRQDGYGKLAVEKTVEEFGKRYIILPNPTYGDWYKDIARRSDSCPGGLMKKRLIE